MGKAKAIVALLLLIGLVVAVSGCTSDDTSSTSSSGSGSDSVATQHYDADSGVTSGTTQDGYGYAYNDQGYVAVSDGQDTYVADPDGNVYKYN